MVIWERYYSWKVIQQLARLG